MAKKRKAATDDDQYIVGIDGTRGADGHIEMATAHFVIRNKETGEIVRRCTPAEVEAHNHSSVVAAKKKTPPRRHGEWKDAHDAALESLLRTEGKDSDAREDLERALDGMLGGTGQCSMTERPPDHVPLSARVGPDGWTVIAECPCSGCEAARKCKCPACLAARRFARSGEADRSGEKPASENTTGEEIAEATYDLLRDQLTPARPLWKKLADWLEDARNAEHEQVTLPAKPGFVRVFGRVVNLESLKKWRRKLGDGTTPDANRLRMFCERRMGRR